MKFDIQIIRSKRKTLSIEIRNCAGIIVRAPYKTPDSEIEGFVCEKEVWIEKHLQKMKQKCPENVQRLTDRQLQDLIHSAKIHIPQRASQLAGIMGVAYNKITIKKQTSRWGSCSSKKNLNFNFLLMLCPIEVQDYIIVHELSHLVHMNHSREFWAYVERFCPDYKKCKKWLKENGNSLIERIK